MRVFFYKIKSLKLFYKFYILYNNFFIYNKNYKILFNDRIYNKYIINYLINEILYCIKNYKKN